MNIHEYQAKELLARNGVNVPSGKACKSIKEVQAAAQSLFDDGQSMLVIKSQIHAGGRGKGTFKSGFQGGVHLCKSVDETVEKAEAMLGEVLVTKQTGPEGREVKTLLVASAEKIVKELYLAVLLDRNTSKPIVMASTEGGMDIEEVAEKTPEKIVKETIDPAMGMMPYQARKIAAALNLPSPLIGQAAKLLMGVYKTFWSCDASMV